MFYKNEWPVLEYDDNPVAKLNPEHFSREGLEGFDTDKMVITFFRK